MCNFKTSVERMRNGNIYLNIGLSNTNNPFVFGDKDSTISVTRDKPIVDNPSNYNCVITRFSLNGSGIPLLIAPIQNGQSDPNLTTFALFMAKGGVTYKKYLIFVPRNTTAPIRPSNLIPTQDTTSYYYFIYNYITMVEMCNVALSALYAQLGGTGVPPKMVFDNNSKLFAIIAEADEFIQGNALNPDPFLIYMNQELTVMLSGFHTFFETVTNPILIPSLAPLPSENAELMKITFDSAKYYQSLEYTPTYPPLDIIYEQNYVSVGNWTAFKSIVFVSSNFPGSSELIGNGTTVRSILKDFIPDFNIPSDGRDNLKFDSRGEYRRINLVGTDPLTYFELQVYWRNVYGDLILIPVWYLQAINIRILFEPKH